MSSAAKPTRRAWHGARGSVQTVLLVGVAVLAAGLGVAAYLSGAWAGFENASINTRLSLRGARHPRSLVVVGVDDRTLDALDERWPFPRRLDAQAVDALHAAGARTIVYDVQFAQRTTTAENLALEGAIARAGNVVLASAEIGPHGESNVGGGAGLLHAHARAGAPNLRVDASGAIQQYAYSIGRLKTLAVAAAEVATGQTLAPSAFEHDSAWIDFPGPAGTIPTVSFTDLLHGRVGRGQLAGKIVVVGATSPVLQDLEPTSAPSSSGISGPELQADAIWTALRGNPLRSAPGWLALLTIVLAGIATPLSSLTMRAGRALLMGVMFAFAYMVLAQVLFDQNLILVLTYPLEALGAGTLGALLVSYLAERWEHQLTSRYRQALEQTVRARTAELLDTQLEVIRRLAQAAELRDESTGAHIDRVGEICEKVALQMGMSAEEAERLRIASTLHDVGKIGLPDRVLRKRGELNEEEWEQMKAHTTTGARLLSGSRSPLLQMAEVIARTHHERWDGSGYPFGLRGEEIPLVGRICAICDVFDALRSEREYKQAWPLRRVVEEITRKRGSHFDPAVVDALLFVLGEQAAQPAQVTARRAAGLPV